MFNINFEKDIVPIVKLMVPAWPEILPEKSDPIINSISRFVTSEIQGMESYLRFPYLILLKIFRFLAIIFYGHTFNKLPFEKKNQYFSRWENSRFNFMRDFIKLFRSLVVLAFYEHSSVCEAININKERHKEISITKRLEYIAHRSYNQTQDKLKVIH